MATQSRLPRLDVLLREVREYEEKTGQKVRVRFAQNEKVDTFTTTKK